MLIDNIANLAYPIMPPATFNVSNDPFTNELVTVKDPFMNVLPINPPIYVPL